MKPARLAGTATLLLVAAACMDLSVTNPNNPDRERATAQPVDVQALVSTSFRRWWQAQQGGNWPVAAFTSMADEFTTNFVDFGEFTYQAEPRVAYINTRTSTTANLAATPWGNLYGSLSNVNDALAAFDRGVVIDSVLSATARVDLTPRARAFARFMQGLNHAYLALYFDQAYVLDEKIDLEVTTPEFQPYPAVLDSAIRFFEMAIEIADTNQFVLPNNGGWINRRATTNEELVQLSHTMIARSLVYVARSREERAAVDWERVLDHLDKGIQTDITPIANPAESFASAHKTLIARQRTTTPGDNARADYFLVGPADTTGKFQYWVASPITPDANQRQREPFQFATPDRRIQGTAGPASRGKYFGYHLANLGQAARGLYLRSWYYYHRTGVGESGSNGPILWLTMTEMDMLRAEALIRLGRASEAVPLINKTRVANGELPPVTIEGPPDTPSCVPRKLNGACGSLWDALRYEKRIEGAGIDPPVAFFDARGWGTLVQNTFVHLPVPARELEIVGSPLYTFGGPGGNGSAPALNPETCPVALPRCP